MSVKYDKRPVLVKYPMGRSVGKTQNTVFGDWNVIYAEKNNPTIDVEREVYGKQSDFDMIITVDSNQLTKRIDDRCVFLIDEYPTEHFGTGNFRVEKIFPEFMGTINIGLKSKSGNSLPDLYYLGKDGEIYAYQLNYDSKTGYGYIDRYISHPFKDTEKIWLIEPQDKNDDNNLLEYVSEVPKGIVYNLNSYNRIEFKEFDYG